MCIRDRVIAPCCTSTSSSGSCADRPFCSTPSGWRTSANSHRSLMHSKSPSASGQVTSTSVPRPSTPTSATASCPSHTPDLGATLLREG
eukprot:14457556-Alexandrium_andersonii.AAC.1